ncbi:MAG: hypothetical protein ACPGWR_22555, partial [Ardenticatenaceae bacterium]
RFSRNDYASYPLGGQNDALLKAPSATLGADSAKSQKNFFFYASKNLQKKERGEPNGPPLSQNKLFLLESASSRRDVIYITYSIIKSNYIVKCVPVAAYSRRENRHQDDSATPVLFAI